MRKNKERTNNKGFSLVELIIVVAIMAVLMGVLAPTFMKYVEDTRLQKDNSAIGELANAMKIAVANEAVMDDIIATAANGKITIGTAATGAKSLTFTGTLTPLQTELKAVIGDFKTTSKTYNKSTAAIEVTVTPEGKVTAVGFIDKQGGTATTATNPKPF